MHFIYEDCFLLSLFIDRVHRFDHPLLGCFGTTAAKGKTAGFFFLFFFVVGIIQRVKFKPVYIGSAAPEMDR